MLPYVWACFPDYCFKAKGKDQQEVTLIDAKVVLKAFVYSLEQNAALIKTDAQATDNIKHKSATALKISASMMENVQQFLERFIEENKIIVQTPQLRPSAPEVVLAYNLTDLDLFRLMIDIAQQTIPHPSQVLWCDENVTTGDLLYFLQRLRKFTYLPFLIMRVNKLQLEVREKLLEWASNLFLTQEEKKVAPLTLIFTEKLGVEVFSFLRPQEKKQGDFLSEKQLASDESLK